MSPHQTRLLPALLGLGLLLAACGTPTPTTPTSTNPATTPTNPAPTTPTPTLTLPSTQVSVQAGQSVTITPLVNLTPDRLEVSGLPGGLTVTATASQITLNAVSAAPGTYPLTVTGVWGSLTVQIPVTVTVTAAPVTITPDFNLSLSESNLNLTSGQSGNVNVNVIKTDTLTSAVNLTATVSGSGLTATLSGQQLTLNASQASAGTYQVTVTGQAGTLVRRATLTVTVSAPTPAPVTPSVSNVTVSASSSTITAGNNLNLHASVTGTGNYDPNVTWQVSGGNATLTPTSSGQATLSVPQSASAGRLTITATSVQDTSKTGTFTVDVKAAPQTVTLAQNSTSVEAGKAASVAFSGQVQSVTFTQTTSLLSSVTLSGSTLNLVAGPTTGTTQVNLTFTMQDGGKQQATLTVTVTAPIGQTNNGYTWYPESQRAASTEELEVLRLTNAVRASGTTCGGVAYPPAPALTWSDTLAHAARNHALDMAKRNYFSHVTPEGVTFDKRITQAGYNWSTIAENIAAGYPTSQAVVDGWVKSSGHCVNLMNPNLKELGVGFIQLSGTTYKTYWNQDFGTPR